MIDDYEINPLISGFFSGIISSTITTPVDRLLPVLQQDNAPKNIFTWLTNSFKQNGVKTTFAGNYARILHGGTHTFYIWRIAFVSSTEYYKILTSKNKILKLI